MALQQGAFQHDAIQVGRGQVIGVGYSEGAVCGDAETFPSPVLIQRVAYGGLQSGQTAPSNPFTIRLANPVGAGNCIVLLLDVDLARTVSSITDDVGNAWSSTPVVTTSGSDMKTEAYVLGNSNAGARSFVITFDSVTTSCHFILLEYANVAGVNPVGATVASSAATSPSIQAPTITGNNGNLLIHYAWNGHGNIGQQLGLTVTSWTAAAGWTLEEADYAPGQSTGTRAMLPHAVQVQIANGVPVTPTLTTSTSEAYNTICFELKGGLAAGTFPAPGIRVKRIQWLLNPAIDQTTWNAPFPCSGNLLVIMDIQGAIQTAPTDNKSNAWTAQVAGILNTLCGFAWSSPATVGPDLVISIPMATGTTNTTFAIYDIEGAHPKTPFVQETHGLSQNLDNATVITAIPQITPTFANGLVLTIMGVGQGPVLTVSQPAGALFTPVFYPQETDFDTFNNADAYSIYYYGLDLSAQSYNWTTTQIATNSTTGEIAAEFRTGSITIAEGPAAGDVYDSTKISPSGAISRDQIEGALAAEQEAAVEVNPSAIVEGPTAAETVIALQRGVGFYVEASTAAEVEAAAEVNPASYVEGPTAAEQEAAVERFAGVASEAIVVTEAEAVVEVIPTAVAEGPTAVEQDTIQHVAVDAYAEGPIAAELDAVFQRQVATYLDGALALEAVDTAPAGAKQGAIVEAATAGDAYAVSILAPSAIAEGPTAGDSATALNYYVFPPNTVTIWKPGVTYNGGIPSGGYAIHNPAGYSPSGGDDVANVQALIDAGHAAHPTGVVIKLNAGVFNFDSGFVLIPSNTVLRGAGTRIDNGVNGTLLNVSNGASPLSNVGAGHNAPIVIIGPARFTNYPPAGVPPSGSSTDLTADGTKGQNDGVGYYCDVTNATGFSAGMMVLVDELSKATFQTDPSNLGQILAASDWRVVWNLHNPGQPVIDDPLTPGDPVGGAAASWFCRQGRPTCEVKVIDHVSSNRVYFTTPLHITYRTANGAQLSRFEYAAVSNSGLEDLSGRCGQSNFTFNWANHCWMKNVESYNWNVDPGIAFTVSFQCELRDSYCHDNYYPQQGGGGYSICFMIGSADCLIENSISIYCDKVMVSRCAGAGCVVGYNYMDVGYLYDRPTWQEMGLNSSHMVGPHHTLFEGNRSFNCDSDKTHGNSIYMTSFRNHLSGRRRTFINLADGTTTVDNGFRCHGPAAFGYWFSAVANVLGESGQMTGWHYEDDTNQLMVVGQRDIWALGWDDWYTSFPQLIADPNVSSGPRRIIRDANWDWLQSQQTWHESAVHDLQNSLYLTGVPPFFGGNTWPWVDPSSGTTYTLPAKQRFDALPTVTVGEDIEGTIVPGEVVRVRMVISAGYVDGAIAGEAEAGTTGAGPQVGVQVEGPSALDAYAAIELDSSAYAEVLVSTEAIGAVEGVAVAYSEAPIAAEALSAQAVIPAAPFPETVFVAEVLASSSVHPGAVVETALAGDAYASAEVDASTYAEQVLLLDAAAAIQKQVAGYVEAAIALETEDQVAPGQAQGRYAEGPPALEAEDALQRAVAAAVETVVATELLAAGVAAGVAVTEAINVLEQEDVGLLAAAAIKETIVHLDGAPGWRRSIIGASAYAEAPLAAEVLDTGISVGRALAETATAAETENMLPSLGTSYAEAPVAYDVEASRQRHVAGQAEAASFTEAYDQDRIRSSVPTLGLYSPRAVPTWVPTLMLSLGREARAVVLAAAGGEEAVLQSPFMLGNGAPYNPRAPKGTESIWQYEGNFYRAALNAGERLLPGALYLAIAAGLVRIRLVIPGPVVYLALPDLSEATIVPLIGAANVLTISPPPGPQPAGRAPWQDPAGRWTSPGTLAFAPTGTPTFVPSLMLGLDGKAQTAVTIATGGPAAVLTTPAPLLGVHPSNAFSGADRRFWQYEGDFYRAVKANGFRLLPGALYLGLVGGVVKGRLVAPGPVTWLGLNDLKAGTVGPVVNACNALVP